MPCWRLARQGSLAPVHRVNVARIKAKSAKCRHKSSSLAFGGCGSPSAMQEGLGAFCRRGWFPHAGTQGTSFPAFFPFQLRKRWVMAEVFWVDAGMMRQRNELSSSLARS